MAKKLTFRRARRASMILGYIGEKLNIEGQTNEESQEAVRIGLEGNNEDLFVLAAFHGDELTGFLIALYFPNLKSISVLQLYVADNFADDQIDMRLLNMSLNWANSCNAVDIRVKVGADDGRLWRFVEANGFETHATIYSYRLVKEDEILDEVEIPDVATSETPAGPRESESPEVAANGGRGVDQSSEEPVESQASA